MGEVPSSFGAEPNEQVAGRGVAVRADELLQRAELSRELSKRQGSLFCVLQCGLKRGESTSRGNLVNGDGAKAGLPIGVTHHARSGKPEFTERFWRRRQAS